MKRLINLFLAVILLCTVTDRLFAQGTTAFTYQGRLNDAGSVAGGNYDLSFALFGVSSGGSALTAPITNSPTFVTNGLFNVTLDFSNQFNGSPRWLEVRVRGFGDTVAYTFLSPRQQLTPTPYALFASSSSNAAAAATLTGPVPGSGISGSYSNVVTFNSPSNQFTGFYSGNGSGLTNVPGGFLTWRIYDSTNLLSLANTGYVLTSSNFVTVTLPSTTNISDLLRIVATGSGGWKIACQTNQSIFVNNLVGSIGANWSPVLGASTWFSIASSTDGSHLLAVNGSSAFTSTDGGTSWALSKTGPLFISAASSADGTFLAAGESGVGAVWTSGDGGATWVSRLSPGNWTSIATSATGQHIAATWYGSSSGQVWVSNDYGTNWLGHGTASKNWFAVDSSTDGTKLVACQTNGNIFTSVDGGTTWTSRDSVRAWHGVASSSDGTKLAACVYNGTLYTSIDSGVTWSSRGPTQNWSSIASSADGSRLVATVFGGGAYVSGDSGLSWATHSPSTNWWTVASSSDGTILAGGVRTGNIYVTSPSQNVSTTNYITGTQGSAIELLSTGLGQFVPISFMGNIYAY